MAVPNYIDVRASLIYPFGPAALADDAVEADHLSADAEARIEELATGQLGPLQAELDAHEANTSNPHATTAAQVGAPTTAALAALQAELDTHEANTSNPHGVTAAQAGAAAATHAATHITGGSDVIANVVAAGASGLMTGADKAKLNGIAAGATANSSDAALVARGNHTGTQAAATISDFAEAVDDRVGTLLTVGAGLSKNYNDGSNMLTLAVTSAVKLIQEPPLVKESYAPLLADYVDWTPDGTWHIVDLLSYSSTARLAILFIRGVNNGSSPLTLQLRPTLSDEGPWFEVDGSATKFATMFAMPLSALRRFEYYATGSSSDGMEMQITLMALL